MFVGLFCFNNFHFHKVDLGLFLFRKFSNFTPPPRSSWSGLCILPWNHATKPGDFLNWNCEPSFFLLFSFFLSFFLSSFYFRQVFDTLFYLRVLFLSFVYYFKNSILPLFHKLSNLIPPPPNSAGHVDSRRHLYLLCLPRTGTVALVADVGGGGLANRVDSGFVSYKIPSTLHIHVRWSDGMRCCRSYWPELCLFCCYQPLFVVSQQSWFGFFCVSYIFQFYSPLPPIFGSFFFVFVIICPYLPVCCQLPALYQINSVLCSKDFLRFTYFVLSPPPLECSRPCINLSKPTWDCLKSTVLGSA